MCSIFFLRSIVLNSTKRLRLFWRLVQSGIYQAAAFNFLTDEAPGLLLCSSWQVLVVVALKEPGLPLPLHPSVLPCASPAAWAAVRPAVRWAAWGPEPAENWWLEELFCQSCLAWLTVGLEEHWYWSRKRGRSSRMEGRIHHHLQPTLLSPWSDDRTRILVWKQASCIPTSLCYKHYKLDLFYMCIHVTFWANPFVYIIMKMTSQGLL